MEALERTAEVRYAAPAELPSALAGAHVLLGWDFSSRALADAWPHADRLRWVHMASAGVDTVLIDPLVDSDVVLTNSRGVFERPIAEYVLGQLLAFVKDFDRTRDLQRRHTWQHRETGTLLGKRAVVVGSGPIGREIGTLLQAVGMRVRLVGRSRREDDPDFGLVVASGDLVTAVTDADFVVGAAPLTDQTRGLFDRAVFAAMPRHARFLNVGRGPSVVEADLLTALREGELAGAALDVFAEEPLPPDHPFWDVEGLVVSPHVSADTVGWREALVDLFSDNLRRWRRGEPLRNLVDKHLGYVPGPDRTRDRVPEPTSGAAP
jgi:phosphoglycerate dehydrogenase-like enzyme